MDNTLRTKWFVPESIGDTVKNVIEAADLDYLAQVPQHQFASLLIHEVRFLAPYSPQEARAMEQYVEQHLTELYRFMQGLAQYRRGSR